MKYKKSNSIIFAICITSIILGNFINEKGSYLNLSGSNDSINRFPRVSKSWDLNYSIIIDNNWSDTRDTYDWCSGLGTSVNPYVIENITINGQYKDFYLIILNTNDYFIIRNSTFSNVENIPGSVALKLKNVTNGMVLANEISDNGYMGISLESSENIQVSHNQFRHNENHAIYIFNSNNISISNNYFEDNYYPNAAIRASGHQIIIRDNFFEANSLSCGGSSSTSFFIYNNTIRGGSISLSATNSKVINNVMTGITHLYGGRLTTAIGGYPTFSEFINNSLSDFRFGILFQSYYSDHSAFNDVINNSIENTEFGIEVRGASYNNTFTGNSLKNNVLGMKMGPQRGSYDNIIYANTFEDNDINAEDGGTNNRWNNSYIGNFWDDYNGIDADDDGIGDTPYYITNPYGNHSIDYRPIQYTIPEITILSPLNNSYWNKEPTIKVISTDHNLDYTWYNISTYQEFLEPNIAEPLRTDIWGSLPEGAFLIEFFANDTININDRLKFNIIKDTTSPTISIQSPLNYTEFINTSPEFDLNVFDINIHQIWYSFDNQNERIYITSLRGVINTTLWDNLSDGNVTITFGISDQAGNIAYQILEVIKITIKAQIYGYNLLIVILLCSVSLITTIHKNRTKHVI